MFIFKDGERVYLPAWEINTCVMLQKLADIVESKGGEVKPSIKVLASNWNIENDPPRKIWGRSYITFLLDGIVYSFSVNENIFFEHYYQKTPLYNGQYSRNVYADEFSRRWITNPLLRTDCTDEQCAEAAGILFGLLTEAKMSVEYQNSRSKWVKWSEENG